MDARILQALSISPEGWTVKQLTAQLRAFYPEDKDLKSSINSLLYTVLAKSKRVQKHEPAAGTQAPIWRLADDAVITLVDLETATAVELTAAKDLVLVRYFGPLEQVNYPPGTHLSPCPAFKLALAVAEERSAGRKVRVVSSNPGLRVL
jgi:hypothetical protein